MTTAIAVVCAAGSTASAEVGAPVATVQAVAADAQFLEYAPPPAAPGVVCLVDSGVDPNPDTTPILAGSYALEPGTDTSDELSRVNPPLQPGGHPDGHGTYMAMIMAAPQNGWGMVGIAPTSVRVFNVKALGAGAATFSFAAYANAIVHCADGPVGVSGLSVVNLSLASDAQPTAAESNALSTAVEQAHRLGLNVVGAAGNGGGDVAYPAAISGILAVGGTDASPSDLGVLCPSSNRGRALALLAPGCGSQKESGTSGEGIDVAFSDDGSPAWASGTSGASAIVSAVLASMRAYAPDLNADQAAGCLTSTLANGGNLDVAAAFRACGLGEVVSEGLAAEALAAPPRPQATATQSPAPSSASPRGPTQNPTSDSASGVGHPRVLSVRFRRGRFAVVVAPFPRALRLHVDVERRSGERYRVVASTSVGGRTAQLKIGSWDRVAVLFTRGGQRSGAVYVTRDTKATGSSSSTPPMSRRGTK